MDVLITVFLPLALAVIMFSLGLGLMLADFKRVLLQPKAFAVGAASQLLLIPLVAYAQAVIFNLPPELAVGVMILSLCPGGVTSNVLTKYGKGDLALSISLTGIISLVAVATVPLLVAFFADRFMGLDAPPVDVTALGLSMFLITAVPVVLGMLVRGLASGFAQRIEGIVEKIALALFAIWFVILGKLGVSPATDLNKLLSQIGTIVYFLFFASLPFLHKFETAKPVPERVTE